MSITEKKLGEVSQVLPGFAFKSQDLGAQGIPVIKIGNIQDDKTVLLDNSDKLPEEKFEERHRKFILKDKDIVLAMTGATAGKVGRIRTDKPLLLNQRVAKIEAVHIDPDFLWLTLSSDRYRQILFHLAGGAAQPNMSGGQIESILINFPAIEIQRAIANILNTYNDLIENNKRRIELLEESARQLYKEWFVRFRFPGHEHIKIIDGVPDGWNPKTLSDIVSVVKDSVDPKSIPETTPYIGLEHLPRRSITLNEWENAGKVSSSKFSFKCGDILFGKIRPYFHKVGFTLTDGITSSDAIVLRPKMQSYYCIALAEVSSDAFVALASKTVREGSKMPRADWDVLKNRVVLEPPEAILNVFNNQIEGILNQCKLLSFQNFNLTKARDILLPKLMSGEIAV